MPIKIEKSFCRYCHAYCPMDNHSWGGIPGTDDDGRVREIGANANRLIDNRQNTQRFTGMTLQSAIPVYITRTEEAL